MMLGMKNKEKSKSTRSEAIFWLFSQNQSFMLKKALYEDISVY